MKKIYDAFISYARGDQQFAAELRDLLNGVEFEIYFDKDRVPAGAQIQPELQKAITASRRVILIVSEAWLASQWPNWEGAVGARREGCIVPIFRVPYEVDRHPYYLNGISSIEWLPDDPEVEARLWQVRCALDGMEPGPSAKWAANWRSLADRPRGTVLKPQSDADESFVARTSLEFDPVREVLCCDRHEQWGELAAEAERPRDCALFVIGARRLGHDFFLARVRRYFPMNPARSICPVMWDPITPTYREEFREALAAALNCAEPRLAASLRAARAGQNLILVHRPVCEKEFDGQALLSYYTKWLPELLAETRAGIVGSHRTGFVKVVQAVAWSSAAQLAMASLGFSAGLDEASWVQEVSARRTLRRLKKESGAGLPVVTLHPLRPLRRRDIEGLSDVLPRQARNGFVRDMLLGKPDTEQILKRVTDRLRRERYAAGGPS